MRRLFFALWPDEALRGLLTVYAQRELASFNGRAMPAENWHVTLAFLGSVAEARLGELRRIGGELAIAPCKLELDRLVVWPRARVLAVAASHLPIELQTFVGALQRRLGSAGFRTEDQPYRAHVTLARNVRVGAMEQTIMPLIWPVNGFVLVESTSSPRGSRYQVIARFP